MVSFELPTYRPPSEARSLLIRASRGCPWNRCAFCNMYHGVRFEVRQVAEVKQDISAMRLVAEAVRDWACRMGYGGRVGEVALANGIPWLEDEGVRRAFIGDSNSLVLRADELAQMVEFLYESFPALERVTSYGRAKTALKKRPEELRRLKEAGLSRLHLGLETGDDELLSYVRKGVSAEQMVGAGWRVKESGISLSEYVILGLGGRERWRQHALGTARVLNRIDPDFIRLRTLVLRPGSLLREWHERGEFVPSSPEEVLRETRLLLENLEVSSELVSDHVSNYIELNGKLPQAKAGLLAKIDRVLEMPEAARAGLLQPEFMRGL